MAIIKVITPSVTDANITTAKVTDNAITLAKMASGTDGNIISYDASGNPVAVATGNDGQVLTSTGAGSPPAFETLPVGGITVADQWRVNSNLSASTVNRFVHISANWEQIDSTGQGTIGTAMSNSSGTFTFPSTGIYLVKFQINYYDSDSNTALGAAIDFSVNNGSSYGNLAQNFTNTHNGSNVNATAITSSLVDVQNASTYKIRFYYYVSGSSIVYGAGQNSTFATFIRLGDT